MNDGHINASMDIDNASLDVTFGEVYEIDKGMPAAIIANLYSSKSTYLPGDYVIYRIRLYKCLVAIETPEEFDSTKWELVKVAEELKEKADKSTTYTKIETNALLDEKVDATSVYTKTETDALLDEKANSDNVYTKAESDTLLDEKADLQSTLAALSTLSAAIDTKADAADTTAVLALKADKTYIDTELDKKADKSSTYTKTEVDTALASKAAADSVYTKLETDEAISDATKAIDANFALEFNPDWTYESGEFCVYEGRFKRCISGYNEPKPFDENDWEDVEVGQLIWGTEATISDGLNGKMDKSNPTGTGTLNINRKAGTTVGEQSVAIGYNSTASGEQSIAGGYSATASNTVSVALGNAANASGFAATAFGTSTRATGNYSQAEGYQTRAGGGSSHAEGNQSYASGGVSHAEGYSTQASGQYSHAEGNGSVAEGSTSHAEGHSTTASGDYSHAEGRESIASAYSCHAEGIHTQATQNYSHSEGCSTIASGNTSHAEGYETTASSAHSHSEGYQTTASGTNSHAEGNSTTASSYSSHAEGDSTIASGDSSHAEGYDTTASGDYSHAEGSRTIANHKSQHVFGEYNVEDDSENEQYERGNYVEIVGNGYWDSEEEEAVHSNARTLDWSGNEVLAGDLTYNGNKSLTSEVQRLDGRINTKANSSEVYTKTEMNSQLQSKANANSVYTKAEVNTKLNAKANVNDVYTKAQVESRLSAKANTSSVYTKEQVDDIVYNILPDDTASGSVANFETDLTLPIKSLEADVNAMQDLHGQDYPFPAGGGKNLFPPKEVSFSGITITLRTDGGIQINGASTSAFNATVTTSLKAGTYTLSCRFNGTLPSDAAARCQIYHQGTSLSITIPNQGNTNSNKQFTVAEDLTGVEFRIRISENFNYQNVIYYPQLEKGSTMTNFVPYAVENICPISGWSEISLTKCGANLCDEVFELGSIDNQTGQNANNPNYCRSKNYIQVPKGVNLYLVNGNSDTLGLRFYDSNKAFIGARAFLTSKVMPYGTYDLPTGTAYIRIVNTSTNVYANNISLNYPSTDTTYHAHNGNTEVINLGGTYYGGHFTQDKDGHRQFKVTHKVFVFTGSESWQTYTNFFFLPAGTLTDAPVQTSVITSNGLTVSPMANGQIRLYPSYGINSQYISMSSTVSELQGYLSNGIQFLYELATHYVIDLPDGEPIITLNGTNNIYADTGDTSVVFKDSVNGYVEKKIASVQALALNT